MIYPDIPLIEWCHRYKLTPRDYVCPKCGETYPTNIPVLLADCAGLESEIHSCGPSFVAVRLKPRTSKAKLFWSKV